MDSLLNIPKAIKPTSLQDFEKLEKIGKVAIKTLRRRAPLPGL